MYYHDGNCQYLEYLLVSGVVRACDDPYQMTMFFLIFRLISHAETSDVSEKHIQRYFTIGRDILQIHDLVEICEIIGKSLGTAHRIQDGQLPRDQPIQRKTHSHTVIVIGLNLSRTDPGRIYDNIVTILKECF